jgi:putative FmdB family regulatory protein
MPIYEFYCTACNTIFNFFSRTVTSKTPPCPRCQRELKRQVSLFACIGKAQEKTGLEDLPINEAALERAVGQLTSEAEHLNENDPRQAANLMRKFSDLTGMKLGDGMQEALRRMESGEDPEKIEAEMGDLLEQEDPFQMAGSAGSKGKARPNAPRRDETLYDL